MTGDWNKSRSGSRLPSELLATGRITGTGNIFDHAGQGATGGGQGSNDKQGGNYLFHPFVLLILEDFCRFVRR